MIKHTSDWTDADLERLEVIARELGARRRDLLAVMMAESGMYTWAHNPNGHASGLIQFMPSTLRHLKYGNPPEEFRKLSVAEQLPFVRRYFDAHRGKLPNISAVYIATFTPAFLAHATEPEWVIASKSLRGVIYNANAGFDTDRDLKIQVRELGQAVERACRGPRWAEMMQRIGEAPPTPAVAYDLATAYGVQQALRLLGFDPGPLDGQMGPRTATALKLFQLNAKLVVDGIFGAKSRAALQAAILDHLASPRGAA